jgi:hypothetical protein
MPRRGQRALPACFGAWSVRSQWRGGAPVTKRLPRRAPLIHRTRAQHEGLSQLAPRVTSDGEGRLTGVEVVAQWRWPAGETRDATVMLCMVGMVLGVRHNSRKRMGEQLRVGSPRRESGSSVEMLR